MYNLQNFLSMPVSGKKMILEINEQTGELTKQKTRSGFVHFFKAIFRPYKVERENRTTAKAFLYLLKQNWTKFADSKEGKTYFLENLAQCQRGGKALTDRDIKRVINDVSIRSADLLYLRVPFDTDEHISWQLLSGMGFEADQSGIMHRIVCRGSIDVHEYHDRLNRFREKNGILTDQQATSIYRNFLRDKIIDGLLVDEKNEDWGKVSDLKKILKQNYLTPRDPRYYFFSELTLRVRCMGEKNPLPEDWVAEFLRRHDEGVLELDSEHDRPVQGLKMQELDKESILVRSLDCGMQLVTNQSECPVAVRENPLPVKVIVDQHIAGLW